MILVQSKNITISYNESQNILVVAWHKNTVNEEYKDVLEKLLQFTIQKKCYYWILDQLEKNGMALPDDAKWVSEVYVPKVIKNMGIGMRVSVVLSKNIFAELSSKKVAKDNNVLIKNNVFDMQYFKSYEDAYNYIVAEQNEKLNESNIA